MDTEKLPSRRGEELGRAVVSEGPNQHGHDRLASSQTLPDPHQQTALVATEKLTRYLSN